MERTKEIISLLENYGNIEQVRIDEDENQAIYVLYYNLRNLAAFKNAKESLELPIIVRFDDKEIVSFRTYYTKDEIELKTEDEVIRIINLVNENFERSKFFIDGSGDICCEAKINIIICDEDELKKALEDLMMGYIIILVNTGGDHER